MPSQSQMHSASSSPPLSLQRRLQILADIDNDEEDEEQEQEDSEHAGSQRRRSYDSDDDEEDEYILVKSSDIRKEVQCPICLGIIRKTRTVMECLHRFCRECIDKAMRLGNNECPACRTHCASRRSLRDDPNYDALIAAIYPDLDKFEEEELAFHEEDKLRNDQIQASIAETQRRQSEAIAKRKNAKANAAATSKKPEERYQNGQNYIIENESRGKRKRRNCSSDPDEDSAVKVSSTEAEDDESLSKRVKRSSIETVSRNDDTIKVSPPEVGVDESLNRRVKICSIETVGRNDSTIKVSSAEAQVDENLDRRVRRSSIEAVGRNDSAVKVPSNEVVSRNNSTIRVPSTEVLSINDSTVKVTSTEEAGRSDSTEKVPATDVVGRNDNIIKIPYLSRNDSTVKAPSTEVVGTNDSSTKVPYLSGNDSTVKVLSTEAVSRNDSTVKFSSSEIVDINDNTVKVPSTEVVSTNDSTINLSSTEVRDADSLNKKENVPSTEKDSKNDSSEKFNEINCDNAAKENCPTGVSNEQNEACKGKTINPGGLVWGKACVRTSMRYGNLGNSNGKNSKKSQAARMVQYLLTKARKEDESMFEVHLTMFPFKNNPPLPRLEKPHFCCGPTVTIMKLCKLLALELQLPVNELEIVLERRDRLVESTPKIHSGKRKNTGAEDEGTVVILEQEMTVSTILEHFPELRGSLVLMYRYKQKFVHRSSNSTNSRESPSCRDQGSSEFSQSGEFLSLAKSLRGFKL